MPILECILIDASTDVIKLTGNDMELGIETKVEGNILEKGKIALDAKLFSEITRKLSDGDSMVTIESDEKYNTTITCDNSVFRIQGKDGDEFSYLPYIEKNKYICLSQFTLKELIRQTIFSISDNESNRMMSGELLQIDQDQLRLVSLDGQRISIRKISLKESYDPIKAVIPGKTLNEISKILSGDMDDDVRIYFTDRHVLFEFDQTVVVSRLLEGEYFQIDKMISSDYNTKITINKKELQGCIERASLLIRESERKPIIINVTDGSMEMKIQSAMGSMNEDIDISKEGRDIMIGFNPKFILDALRVIDDEEITMYLVNPKAPFIIKNDEQSYIYLVLPISFNM